MLDTVFRVSVEGIGHHCSVRDAPECQRSDKLGGTVAHYGIDQSPTLDQFAGEVQSFVASDTSGHA